MPEQRQGGCMPEQGGQPVCRWWCCMEQGQGRPHAGAEAEKLHAGAEAGYRCASGVLSLDGAAYPSRGRVLHARAEAGWIACLSRGGVGRMPEQRPGSCCRSRGRLSVCEWCALADGAAYPSRGRADCMPDRGRMGHIRSSGAESGNGLCRCIK